MISEHVAVHIHLVHVNPDYLLFMTPLTVDVIVMQILFATFRGQ